MEESKQKHFRTTCIVCGLSEYEYLYRPSRSPGPVVKCNNCGFVFVNPIETLKTIIEDGARLYDRPTYLLQSSDLADIEGSWEQSLIEAHLSEQTLRESNAREALRHIENVTNRRGKLLDIGCFCGLFLHVASQAGWDCYGIEPLVMPAIYARGRFNLPIIADTLREDTYPPEFFDVVASFQVFEHLIYPNKEVGKIRQILKPGGYLVIEVPNIDTSLVELLGSRHRHYVQDHVSFFSGETLGRLLNRMGFEIRECFYPERILNLERLIWWIDKESGIPITNLSQKLPRSLRRRSFRLGLGDIVTVIAQKV